MAPAPPKATIPLPDHLLSLDDRSSQRRGGNSGGQSRGGEGNPIPSLAKSQTYATTNFLLWLQEHRKTISQQPALSTSPSQQTPKKAPAAESSRNLCLLVVANAPLVTAWSGTLNNDALLQAQRAEQREMETELARSARSGTVDKGWAELLGDDIEIPESEDQSDLCWQDGKGFRVWDCTSRGRPKFNDRGIVEGYDVVLITAQMLQTRDAWVTKVKWSTVLADEAHEFLRGQHGKAEQSITLQNWGILQRKTKSIFIISGTPFVTNIVHDFGAMTRAIACEPIRRQWSEDCTDAGLQALVKGWIPLSDTRYTKFKDAEDARRKKMAELLSIFMIRRTEKSLIRGQAVIHDYFKQCPEDLVPIKAPPDEISTREKDFTQRFEDSRYINSRRNQWLRCVSWSRKYIEWETKTKESNIWDNYTLEDAKKLSRARALIEELEKAKDANEGIVIFSQRTFLSEWVLMVR